MRRMLLLGAVMGVAMLGRDELALSSRSSCCPLALVAPGALAHAGAPGRRRAPWPRWSSIAPWVGYNMSRLRAAHLHQLGARHHPGLGQLRRHVVGAVRGLLVPRLRSSMPRSTATPTGRCSPPQGQAYALHYISTHKDRFLRVELARLGRAFGAFHPLAPDRSRLLRRDTPVPLGAGRARHVLRARRPWPWGAPSCCGAARVPIVPAVGPRASTSSSPCCSASATPGTGPPSRWPWRSWPPCSSTRLGAVRRTGPPTDVVCGPAPGRTVSRPAPPLTGARRRRTSAGDRSVLGRCRAPSGGGPGRRLHHPSRSFSARMGRSTST